MSSDQGWDVNEATDKITFLEAPGIGTNNITVKQFASASYNATPVFAVGAWCGAYGYPGEVEFFGDRLCLASSLAQPQTVWLSRIDDYTMFGKATPIADDDAINVTLNARELNQVTDLFPVQHLLALTTGGIWKIAGDANEVLAPTTINAKLQPSEGSATLPALAAGETALYVTHQGSEVRDLAYTFEADGYAGSDLTAFAKHLLEPRSIVDWTWAKQPTSMAVAACDDGLLLTMTYKREHQVVAWAWHDTQGTVESVTTIPEGKETAVYLVVRRTLNGAPVRTIERMGAWRVDDLRAALGLDCALTFDGRNTTTKTMTVTGLGNGLVQVDASASTFSASNVGDAIVFEYGSDTPLRVEINAYVSPGRVTGIPNAPITNGAHLPTTDWAFAFDTFAGLDHLNGLTVGCAADGEDRGTFVVADGKVTLPVPGVLVQIGLPYTCEFESLDMNVAGGEPVGNRKKLIREVGVMVKDTRGLEVGNTFDAMQALKARTVEPVGVAAPARSEWLHFNVPASWEKNPRVCIRNRSPLPQTILAIAPEVTFGG